MNYQNGDNVALGDIVSLGGGIQGAVVAVLGDKKFSPRYPEKEWGYLGSGILVESNEAGVVHVEQSIDSVTLIARYPDGTA